MLLVSGHTVFPMGLLSDAQKKWSVMGMIGTCFLLQEQQSHLMSSEDLGHMPVQGLPESLLCIHMPSSCLMPLQLAASFCQDLGEGKLAP